MMLYCFHCNKTYDCDSSNRFTTCPKCGRFFEKVSENSRRMDMGKINIDEDFAEEVLKQDKEKLRYDLVDYTPLEAIAKVFTHGYDKYGKDAYGNWKEESGWREVEPKRYKAAFMRHYMEYLKDTNHIDEDSGLPSIYHALWNLWVLTYFHMKEGGDA